MLGASGFLGSRIARALEGAGVQVLRAARRGPIRIDLAGTGVDELAERLAESAPDLVVNAAGRAWQASEQEMWEANGSGVRTLAEALRAAAPAARLVQLGSVHEYGPGTPGAGTPEEQPPAPVTPYGKSKLAGAEAVLAAAAAGQPAVVLRIANVCGPGTPPGSLLGALGARLAAAAARGDGEPLTWELPPMTAQRDYVDVRDVVDAVLAVCAPGPLDPAAGLLNIGGGAALPMGELIDRLVRASGLEVRIAETAAPPPSRTDVDRQQLDIAKARRLLGWYPRRGLDESLRDLLTAAAGAPDDRHV
ncbi:NAD-dependent epimerase/dehydratase family protein [Kitasatospora sp. NPDC006697]|uniref:NAD-dependent epimerase/dehydratase family protein n=1 Tax=Kitasatospora sp. NPDC006697 TaxID=3364020 RepID=UPI00368C8E3F